MPKEQADITTIQDEPISDATLFGFDKKSQELVDFLTSDKTIAPIVIAVHGEWGSGKSTLLLTTEKKLNKEIIKKSLPIKTIYFEAWKYEGSNPAAALVYKMIKPLESSSIPSAISIGKLAIDVLARNTINMKLDEI